MDKIVILDRDGVINVDLMTYVTKPEEFEAVEGSLEAIALLNKNGYKVCIATNQACIERKIISENELSNGSSGPQLRCRKFSLPVCKSRLAGMHGRLPT